MASFRIPSKLQPAVELLRQTFREFIDDEAMLLSAALAFYAVISLAPTLILLVMVVGAFLGEQSVQQEVVSQVRMLAGGKASETVRGVIERASRPDFESFSAVVGVAILLFGATRVFAQLQQALNHVWSVQVKRKQDLRHGIWTVVRKRLVSLLMLAVIAVLLLVVLLVSAGLSMAGELLAKVIPLTVHAKAVHFALSIIMITGLFAFLYKFLPDVRVSWKDTWIGAASTALLFVAGNFVIASYLGNRAAGSAYGAAGSLVLLLLWVYYSAVVFFLGAEFTEVYAKRYGSGIRPEPYAERVIRKTGNPKEPSDA